MAAGLIFVISFTGCGGGDDGPAIVAPGSLQARSYNFSESGTGAQAAVSFTSATAYTFQHPTGAIDSGNYVATRDGNTWNVQLNSAGGTQQIFVMAFASAGSGSYVRKRSEEQDRTGTFSPRSSTVPSGDIEPSPVETTGDTTAGPTTTAGNPTTSTTGDPTTSTTGNPPTTGGAPPSDQYTGFAPVSVAGRTLFGTRTFTSTGTSGQTHTYTFGNGTYHDSDPPEEADGTFVYSANNSSATLSLTYTSPADFVGDRHVMTMTFSARDRGTFQSTYTRGDGTTITINGDFEFQPLP